MDSDKKKLVSSEVLVKFSIKQLFEDNLIDADNYVYAMNVVKDELILDTVKFGGEIWLEKSLKMS